MAAVSNKDTRPEILVRRALHRLGYRFRLHRGDLPGTPDIVLPKYKLCIFVHGCFWHRHPGCKRASMPSTNVEFWERKFEKNVNRDAATADRLTKMGWRVKVIWTCQTSRSEDLMKALNGCLSGTKP
jgi:DNA mismatch endonuclease, patch repair protein